MGKFEQHICGDVSLAFMQYWEATNDLLFLKNVAYPVVFEIANFWASRASLNSENGFYEILDVMGPDEYHNNVNNSCYTNVVAKKALECAIV